jgi:hypothetical protein
MAKKDTQGETDTIALDLLTKLFAARQRRSYCEREAETAKENLKAAKQIEENTILEIQGEVPRLHALAKEKNVLHQGLESLPPLEAWAAEESKKRGTIPNAEEGETELRFESEDDPEFVVTSSGGKIRFGHFSIKSVPPIDGGTTYDFDANCDDCSKTVARIRIPMETLDTPPASENPVERIRLIASHGREAAKVHNDLFHGSR